MAAYVQKSNENIIMNAILFICESSKVLNALLYNTIIIRANSFGTLVWWSSSGIYNNSSGTFHLLCLKSCPFSLYRIIFQVFNIL